MLALKLLEPLSFLRQPRSQDLQGDNKYLKLFIHHDNAGLFSSKGSTVVLPVSKGQLRKRDLSQ